MNTCSKLLRSNVKPLKFFTNTITMLNSSTANILKLSEADARSLPYDISDECLLLAVVAFYWDAWYPVRVNINGLDIIEPQQVKLASESLLNGHIITVPTDTIYGIAGLAQNSEAIERIYNVKKRDHSKPIAISVGAVNDIYKWSKVVLPQGLLDDLLPGPVTVVLERSPQLNPDLNPGTQLVGIRIPNHPFIIELARKCGGPIALTSANISSSRSSLNIEEFRELWPQLDLICDGGQLGDTEFSRRGSTVVDLSVRGKYKIIRDGSAKKETLQLLEQKYNLEERS